MTHDFSPVRNEAIRNGLMTTVETATRKTLGVGARRWVAAATLLVVGIVTGGAVSAAAVSALQERGSTDALVPAPPGVIPGQPIISMLGTVTSFAINGSATLQLPAAPDGATHMRVTTSCLTPGTTTFGPDASGNNPSMQCFDSDFNSGTPSPGWEDIPVPTTASFYVESSVGSSAVITFQFLNYVPTELGVNANGKTFGTSGFGAEPDLVAVVGVDTAGNMIEGYARASDLNAFGPDWPSQPSNPGEAIQWQTERNERYPNGWDIPIFESDGITQIGTHHIYN